MHSTKCFEISPPEDVELRIEERTKLKYLLTFPAGYKEKDQKGLIFVIPGFGDNAESEYQTDKLRPYLADKYDCIVAGVRYHNDLRVRKTYRINIDKICKLYELDPNYFSTPLNFDEIISKLESMLIQKGIFRLDPKLAIKMDCYDTYNSFGFLPALDHLKVLYDIMHEFQIIKSRIVAYGSSYGGYIAMLMGKYAPKTFFAIIDNSGFCVADPGQVTGNVFFDRGGALSFIRYSNGKRYEIPILTDNKWSIDETSCFYYSDGHRKIRSLLEESHRVKSDTIYCSFHSVKDIIVPVPHKDKCIGILSKYNKVFYKKIEEKDIDGKLFKNIKHGMDASLRKLYDHSVKNILSYKQKRDNATDFDLNSNYSFKCC
ncbi:MAG: DUF2920 family protein, partial [Thermodesulfobacteriota bacterium]|nr:DUF2920 family protein [Thermodesulfobacteriota bacterium]